MDTHGLGDQPHYAERIAELLDRVSRLARELQFVDGLNPAQWEALRFVSRANRYSRSPGAFAEFIGTTKGTASQTLIALEQKGLLERARSAADRRQVELRLTTEGRAMLARDPITNIEQVAELLTPDVGMAMVRGLTRLLHDLQSRHGLKTFGVCGDCNLNCVTAEAVPAKQCGHTGELLDARDMRQICVDFVPCPEGQGGTGNALPRGKD